jgi:hypothetical protein
MLEAARREIQGELDAHTLTSFDSIRLHRRTCEQLDSIIEYHNTIDGTCHEVPS